MSTGQTSQRQQGLIATALSELISKLVEAHGLVVWFDPERQYAEIVGSLDFREATLLCYDGSFFKLRHEIEPFLQGEQPPRLVIYVPIDEAATREALVEATAAGVTIYPGAESLPRNTRLAVLARRSLKGVLREEKAADLAKRVESGLLTLADIDRIAEQGEGVGRGALSLIFDSTDPIEIALAFLGSDQHDSALVEKGALAELADLLGTTFDVDLRAMEKPVQLRDQFARHVLAGDLISSLGGDAPPALAAIHTARTSPSRDACRSLARAWRARRDLRESYAAQASRVEQILGLSAIQFSFNQLSQVETFLCLEEALQDAVEGALIAAPNDALAGLAERRQSSFWPEQEPGTQARWALIATAAQVLLAATRVETGLTGAPASIEALLQAYAAGDQPWCLLDTAQRHLERRLQAFDLEPDGRHRQLSQLVVRARQRYMDAGSALAERFVRAYQPAGFRVQGVPRQREVFSRFVAPALKNGKTAYVLVDALRFEMARELVQSLGERFETSLTPAIGTVPTITEIGMAALLPKAETGLSLLQTADSKLALQVDGVILKNRKDRVEFLKSHAGAKVFETTLEQLVPLTKRAIRDGINEAELVLVTSREIDDFGEGDNLSLARRAMDGVLNDLARAFQALAGLGVQTIVVSADHGHIFADELDSDMKIDAPGGETADLHRRVWVGRGGAASESYLRAPAAGFDLGGDLEIAVPWNFACFKAPAGARAYFHGGLSPQELVVPVAVLTPKATQAAAPGSAIDWHLQLGSKRITTRFVSVQVTGRVTQLLEPHVPAVRVELRDAGGLLSAPVSSSYGFDEGTTNVQLQLNDSPERELEPNTITLMLTRDPAGPEATIHLLDAVGEQELARHGPIEVALAI